MIASKWSGWRELHSRPPRSRRGRLLLTYTLKKLTRAHWRLAPAITSIVRDLCRRPVSTRVKCKIQNGCSGWIRTGTVRVTTGWTTIIRLSSEIGAPSGTCTHNLPADNGLLFYSATGAKWTLATDWLAES